MSNIKDALESNEALNAYLENVSLNDFRADIATLINEQSTAVAVAKPKKEAKRFVKPDLHDLAAYFYQREHPACNDEAQAFFDHYESNGWKVGGRGPMKCWKSSVRNWMRNHAKGMFAAPEKTGMLGTDISDTGFVKAEPPVDDNMAFLQASRAARLEHQP